MDRVVLDTKLESLRRCVARIEARRPPSAELLARDADAQDIVALNLTRAVQLCVDIAAHIASGSASAAPRTMGEAFDRLADTGCIDGALAARMKAAVGFRNIAVHNYQDIDWQIVHRIIHERLGDFRDFARAVTATPGTPGQ